MYLNDLANKIIAIKTEGCIDRYKSEPQARVVMKHLIKNPLHGQNPLNHFYFNDLKHTSLILYFTTLTLSSIAVFTTSSSIFEGLAIFMLASLASAAPSMIFEKLQCKYLLSVFEEIDEEEDIIDYETNIKNENLKKDIAACNLYLK